MELPPTQNRGGDGRLGAIEQREESRRRIVGFRRVTRPAGYPFRGNGSDPNAAPAFTDCLSGKRTKRSKTLNQGRKGQLLRPARCFILYKLGISWACAGPAGVPDLQLHIVPHLFSVVDHEICRRAGMIPASTSTPATLLLATDRLRQSAYRQVQRPAWCPHRDRMFSMPECAECRFSAASH